MADQKNNYEIERRWLVTKIRGGVATLRELASNVVEIEQGYFEVCNPEDSVRVRVVNNTEAEITVKEGKGVKRAETHPDDRKISLNLGRVLMQKSHHHLFKSRHEIGTFEFDIYNEALNGVIVAENEKGMTSVDDEIQLPDFVEEAVEVTDSLTNLHLARLATDLRGLGAPAMPFVSESLLISIPCISLVGGPGSGKSGVIETLKAEFPDIHFVPEVATIIIGQVGITPSQDPIQNRRFQKAIYKVGRIFRITSTEFAIANNKKAVVLDRPEADGAGYFNGGIQEFEAVFGTTIISELRNVDMAICLEVPSRKIYEEHKKNNPSRSETYEEAAKRGEKTKAIWQRHPNFHLISNEGGWETKVNRVRQLIKSTIKT